MKKKIAVFGNGWSYDYITALISGMEDYSFSHPVDLYLFFQYSSLGNSNKEMLAEQSIYNLPDLKEFDGCIIIGNVLTTNEISSLIDLVNEATIPCISVGCPIEGFPCVTTDNESGFTELIEHLFSVHHIQNPLYVSGPNTHPESIVRKKAFLSVCEKYHCTVPSESILESDWTEQQATALIREYFQSEKPIPDAIICANDTMAFGAYNVLLESDYKIPEDIIVTGFDSIEDCLFVQPILTSVSCNWKQMGAEALALIFQLISGQYLPDMTYISSIPAIRQSCGCSFVPDKETSAFIRHRSPHRQKTTQMLNDMHFRTLYRCIRGAENIEWLHHSFEYYYSHQICIEGKNMMICLQPNFMSVSDDQPTVISRTCDLVYGNFNEKCYFKPSTHILTTLDHLTNTTDKSQIILILSLQSGGALLGYSVFQWDSRLFLDYYLYSWSRHLVQGLELVRQHIQIHELNQQLKELSYTDPLTGVNSRIGCDNLTANQIQESVAKHQNCAIIMADLDRLKMINDHFGHTQGDLALQLLARSLKQSCPDSYVVSRYGGDEFLITGPCETEEELQQLIARIEHTLANKIDKASLPYQLSASIGGYIKSYTDTSNLEQCIEAADRIMYQIKKVHHDTFPEPK